jgi:hypothetical protein
VAFRPTDDIAFGVMFMTKAISPTGDVADIYYVLLGQNLEQGCIGLIFGRKVDGNFVRDGIWVWLPSGRASLVQSPTERYFLKLSNLYNKIMDAPV